MAKEEKDLFKFKGTRHRELITIMKNLFRRLTCNKIILNHTGQEVSERASNPIKKL